MLGRQLLGYGSFPMRCPTRLIAATALGSALAGCVAPERLTWQDAQHRFAEIAPGMTRTEIENRLGPGRPVMPQTIFVRDCGLPSGQKAEDFVWTVWAVGGVKEALAVGFDKHTNRAALIKRGDATADVAVPLVEHR